MFTKNNRKGFTVVELVIVIAIIAILAVALIPTFGGLIDSANATGDIALAREMNIALVLSPNVDNPNKAMEVLQEAGYLVGNFNPRADKNYFAWDSTTNQILYISKDDPTKPLFAADPNYGTPDKWWIAVSGIDKMTDGFSNWIFTENVVAKNDTDVLRFDKPVGLSVVSGKVFDYPVSITTEAAGSIMLDGNFNKKVSVAAPNADLTQYGTASDLEINAIANASAHIHGFVHTLKHHAGRLVVEPQGYIYNFYEKVSAADAGKVEVYGIVHTAQEVTQATYTECDGAFLNVAEGVTAPEGVTVGVPAGYAWKIGSVEELLNFRDAVNSGFGFSGITVALTADLDLSGINWTTPIGAAVTYVQGQNLVQVEAGTNSFQGTFDGNGHTIKGLTIVDMPSTGYGGGLFGLIESATIKNLNLTEVDIRGDHKASPLVARMNDTTVENVKVSGAAAGQWTAGLASYAFTSTVNNCVIDMDLTANGYDVADKYPRLGGVAGQVKEVTIIKTDVSACTFELVGRDANVQYFIGAYAAQPNAEGSKIDYYLDGIPEALPRYNKGGDCNPALAGIEEIARSGKTENITIKGYAFSTLPENVTAQ